MIPSTKPNQNLPAQICTLVVAVALSFGGSANSRGAQRPISEFVSSLGTFCWVLDTDGNLDCAASRAHAGDCFLFFPPTANFVVWTDPFSSRYVVIDYGGIVNNYLQSASAGSLNLGTTITGTISERVLADGRAEVNVQLHTVNALTYAVQGFDFSNNGTVIFGHRTADVLAGKDAALAESFLQVIFINPGPGQPLPDFVELLQCRATDIKLFSFSARATGTLRAAFGVADGTPGQLQTTQAGLFSTYFVANSKSRVALDASPVEHINIQTIVK